MPRPQPSPRLAPAALLLAAAAVAGACAGPGGGPPPVPVLDGEHAPDVLTESRTLDFPPSLTANRFVRGWATWRRKGGSETWLLPDAGGVRLEVAVVDPRERALVLATEVFRSAPGDTVEVSLPGREPFAVPLASPVEIPLPADLPPGRQPVDLRFPADAEVALQGAGFRRSAPTPEVRFEPERILQGGPSLVDVVRRVGGGERLVGRFEPPPDPAPGQRFAILLERDGGPPREVFEWQAGWRGRLPFGRRIDAPLGEEPGLVRLRLAASGGGGDGDAGAGRWLGLGLRAPAGPRSEAGADPAAEGVVAKGPPGAPRIVLLYVLDALRADHLGRAWHGASGTPVLDRLAAEGVVLGEHLSVAPNTLPSTKSLFTGQAFLRRGHARLPEDGPPTLADLFAAAGYRTAVFSGNGYVTADHGLARGFEHVDQSVVFRGYPPGPGRYNDNAARVHAAALAWLENTSVEQPLFLYLHTIHPHNPYDPPPALKERFTGGLASRIGARTEDLLDIKHHRRKVAPPDEERIRALYAGGLAYNDAELEGFLERIVARYPPGEVLVVFTSDHGEELFDHGGVLHGYTLYREQLEIPLLFWWPGRLAPRRLELPSHNLDLHETLRALAGAAPSGLGDGRSLWPEILGAPPPPDPRVRFAAASSVQGGIFMARSDALKLIWAPRTGGDFGMGEGRGRSGDPEFLFDLASDPAERRNLAGARRLDADWLRGRLLAWIERGERLEEASGGEAPELDEEARRRLEALGYLQ